VQNVYWAAETSQKKLITRSLDRYAWHMATLKQLGRLDSMLRMMTGYYGQGTDGDRDSSRLQSAGEQGEVTDMHVNTIRPVLSNTLAIIAGTRPAVKPVATNGDSASAAQTRLAMGLHEHYDRKFNVKTLEIETVRAALITSSWSLVQNWKSSAGEAVAFDDERDQLVYEGDIEIFTVPPWRMAYELTSTTEQDRRWCLFRRKYPRWDLIARAKDPVIKQKLMAGSSASKSDAYLSKLLTASTLGTTKQLDALMNENIFDEDEVWVWELRHLPCPALPDGRLVRFVEPDIVLFDTFSAGEPAQQDGDAEAQTLGTPVKYPYEELHAYEYAPERIVGTANGHTSMFDLMGLQDFIDMCTSSMATTVNLMGMPHLWSPNGNAPNTHQLDTGPTIVETPIKPELIDFPAVKKEILEVVGWAGSEMNKSAALNDTVMGNPQKGMPASAQALQRAQAVQYHQISQDEWVRLIEKNANGRLRLLKRFARTERVAEIAGASGTWELRQWKADDIAGVERFQVEPINPMSATFEGRQAIAEQMGIQGDVLLDFITTGSLKKVTDTRIQQLELVERNKALLLKGKGLAPLDEAQSQMVGVPVYADPGDGTEYISILKSDPHHLAVPAYLAVVNSPESRRDTPLVQAALGVVQESMRLWASLTPDEAQGFGIPPLGSTLAMQLPQAPGAPAPANQPTGTEAPKPTTPQGQPGQAGLPSPPPSPIEGAESPDALSLEA
jgi:hypothetical protein